MRKAAEARAAPISSARSASDEAEDERGDGSDDREPRDPGGRRVPQHVVEVARVDDLEEHPGTERERDQERPGEPHEHSHASGEREREREEPGCPPRLRDRDEVGEGGEEERHQHHREHRERPTDDVRSPAAARGEAGHRDEEQRRDRDGAGAREDLGGEVVRRRRVDDELPLVLLEGALELIRVG